MPRGAAAGVLVGTALAPRKGASSHCCSMAALMSKAVPVLLGAPLHSNEHVTVKGDTSAKWKETAQKSDKGCLLVRA